jgi:hypothetical protein
MAKSIQPLLIILIMISYSASLSAQKTSPTKSETIEYLEDKIEEAEGNYRTKIGTKLYYTSANFYEEYYDKGKFTFGVFRGTVKGAAPDIIDFDDKSKISKYKDYASQQITFTFNPADISSISDDITTPNGEVGQIIIKLKSANGTEHWKTKMYAPRGGKYDGYYLKEIKNESRQTDTLYYTYYKGDKANYERIKKALLHLKELCTEKDLFDD